ncbi:MAG TPA: alpha/beta hydrolase [Nitrolancea sp.]|jgi:pimeloyl-ACP methyl ester carboxylesterase|nr:alpha/beta hydrolase [Nitrolancea sp.]
MTIHPSSGGYVEVDGAKLYYESSGSGPAVVFVHAGIADSSMWDEQFEALAGEYKVVRYDMRNFGQTVADEAAFADWEDLDALLHALSIDSAVIIGASMGATVAVGLALERPELVRGLVLIAPGIFPGHEPSGELRRGWRSLSQALDSGNVDRALDIELDMWVDRAGHRPTPASEAVRQQIRRMNARAYELASDAPNRRPLKPPALTRLAHITVPTLIITGSHDMPDIATIARRLERGIANSRTVVVPDSAHLVNMEQPQAVNQLLLDFLHRQISETGGVDQA